MARRKPNHPTAAELFPNQFVAFAPSKVAVDGLEYTTQSGIGPDESDVIALKRLLVEKFFSSRRRSAKRTTKRHGINNIVGVGTGAKITKGQLTDTHAVIVYVIQKVPRHAVVETCHIPPLIDGVPTDVVETGEFFAAGATRPAPGGVSIGHAGMGSGTLGCLVSSQNKLYLLSNNHVIAGVNQGHLNDPIFQPGPLDPGTALSMPIGVLSHYVPIQFYGIENLVDCAIAQVDPHSVTPINLCYGKISPVPVGVAQGMAVKKCGMMTGGTVGVVQSPSATIQVNYNGAIAVFANQIIISSLGTAFSKRGDSGSLILSKNNQPIGLLCSTSDTAGYTSANPINSVLSQLGVTIVA